MSQNKGLGRRQVYQEAYNRMGSYRAVAKELGVAESTVRRSLQAGNDPAIQSAMDSVGTQLVPQLAWVKTKGEDGVSHSVLLKPAPNPTDFAADIKKCLSGLKPLPPIVPPKQVNSDLCTVYPLMDVHLGMLAWGRETGGEDYDCNLAIQDMRLALSKLLALTPASKKAILIIGGDFFHADDNRSETPAHHHKLDTDSRHWRTLEAGITFLSEVVETLAKRHSEVIIRVLRGNHDEHSHMVLTFALNQRYRLSKGIVVEQDPRDLFMAQWGKCLIASHHGDKAPPERLTLYLSDTCPFWSETKHRYCFTGHVHKEQAKDVGPLRWESLRAFCPADAYAAGMGYATRRAMQSITFHKEDGLVLRAMDPINGRG